MAIREAYSLHARHLEQVSRMHDKCEQRIPIPDCLGLSCTYLLEPPTNNFNNKYGPPTFTATTLEPRHLEKPVKARVGKHPLWRSFIDLVMFYHAAGRPPA